MKPTHLWQGGESLSDVTLYVDWDSVSSMIVSLRIHLFEYGTVPVWNFMLCGGRPELSIGYSWAYTWPSLFAYLLPANHAIIAVWLAMSLVGFCSARALLLRWSGNPLGAAVGACLFVFSGYFAARFNVGQVTFAFFHLVPLIMYLFEVSYARALARQGIVGLSALSIVVSFLFITAGLPHGLIHFYPAFLLLAAFRVVHGARRHGVAGLTAAAPALTANLLGIWLAAYKLWPVIRWQLDFPRTIMGAPPALFESYTVGEVIGNTLIFVRDYFLASAPGPDWQRRPAWGYNAFVGPVPWLLALVAVGAPALPFVRSRLGEARRNLATGFGVLLLAMGIALSLGNDNPLSPAYLFRQLPLFDIVRIFNRYQALIVLGLAVLVAQSFWIISAVIARRSARRVVLAALALAVVAPVLAQTGVLCWNLLAAPNQAILERYRLSGVRPEVPLQVFVSPRFYLRSAGHQTALLQQGYWIANCRSDLSLGGDDPRVMEDGLAPLTLPAPERLDQLGASHITTSGQVPSRFVTANLRVLPGFDVTYGASSEPRATVTVSAAYRGNREGVAASGLALPACGAFLLLLARRAGRRQELGEPPGAAIPSGG